MRGLEHLHPKARAKAEALQKLCKEKGLPLLITETFRTKAEQDALYAIGRTKELSRKPVTNVQYPNSAHCWGVAFDFCRNVKGKEFDDSDGFFKKVADLAKTLGGITWGGNWKSIVDKPHLELTEFMPGSSTKTLASKHGTPESFKKTWGK
ncbi:MAG: M15 family metallopeptidase [Oscillospiraceae bacterium]|nr:M15 family metallopeptidase [Oscillospiraceae bacterium]